MTDKLKWARVKVKAKKFKAMIPKNMAIRIPDEMLDSLEDDELEYFFSSLKGLGLTQQPNSNN